MHRNVIRIISILLSITLILSCMSTNTYAEEESSGNDLFSRLMKPMPQVPSIDEAEFIKATKPIKKRPYNESVLEYSIRIPKDWEEPEDRSSSNFILSENLFLELNIFYGEATIAGRSRIEIHALNQKGNLTAEQWYISYILEGGFTVEGFTTHSKNKVESLMTVMEGDTPYYVRTLAVLNGSKVIMAKYFVPTANMNQQAAMQAEVLKSFKLTNEIERISAESTEYIFLDIAGIKYPKNWIVRAKPFRTVDLIEASFLNIKEKASNRIGGPPIKVTQGKLDVLIVSSIVQDSLIDELEKYKRKIEADGIIAGDKISAREKFVYSDAMDFAITEIYEGIESANNQSEHELWFTLMVGGNYYYFLTLLTPSRNDQFRVWAENTQSYKQILKEFHLMSGAFMERDY